MEDKRFDPRFQPINCDCTVRLQKQVGYIEYWDKQDHLWKQLYPNYRVYIGDRKETVTLLAADGRAVTVENGCGVLIDGIAYTGLFEAYGAIQALVLEVQKEIANFREGGGVGDKFYTQLVGSATDITAPTPVFEIPLDVGEVAILKMDGFFQQRSNGNIVGARLFTSSVVAGGPSLLITPSSIIFTGNASLVGNIFQPNSDNTGVVGNALALSSGSPISWELTLYYRKVTF